MDISRWIAHHAAFDPDRPAVRGEDRTLTYADLHREVGALSSGLAGRLGVGRGDRIGYLGHNSVELLVLLFACARVGAVLVPMNWRLAGPELRGVARSARLRALVTDEAFAHASVELVGDLEGVRPVGVGYAPAGGLALAELADDAGGEFGGGPASGGDLDAPVLLVFTSGTTGRPRGVVLTQRALQCNAQQSVLMHDMTARDIVLTVLPMFHVGGLNNQTTPAIYAGASVVILPRFEPAALLAAVERHGATLTTLVPTTMEAVSAHPAWADTDLATLRAVTTGSAPVPGSVIAPFAARGITVIDMYGSTETCPIALWRRRTDPGQLRELRAYPGLFTEVRIVDPEGRECPDGVPGEILLRGQHIMVGYWDDPEATARALRDGWFATGDVGVREPSGEVRIVDRIKQVIISGGENVYPAEVERLLIEHPAVAEAAVVGVPDPRWQEVPVAVVVPAAGATPDGRELEAYLSTRIARFKVPRRYVFVPELPRNATGKVERLRLRELATREGARHTDL